MTRSVTLPVWIGLFTLLWPLAVNAGKPLEVGIGIAVGIGFADQRGDNAHQDGSDQYVPRLGYAVGVPIRVTWHDLGVTVEGAYVRKGAARELPPPLTGSGPPRTLHYVGGALLAEYSLLRTARWRLYPMLGVSVGYLASAGSSNVNAFERFDIGVVLGAGGAWRSQSGSHEFATELRYDRGFVSTNPNDLEFLNHTGMLVASYRYYFWSRGSTGREELKDRDGDGIADKRDQCPDEPEDDDDFQTDGCPDLDNDGDNFDDVEDECPNDPEDEDGFEDQDGCPDKDNDGDKIEDDQDNCPNEPEEDNGYQSKDGCPDANSDDDGDGLPVADDRCPDAAEDKDGFEDNDGCPDEDNDGDGVPDSRDGADGACKNQPETVNGWRDDDGCKDRVPPRVAALVGVFSSRGFGPDGTFDVAKLAKARKRLVATLTRYDSFKLLILAYAARQDIAENNAKVLEEALINSGIAGERLSTRGCVVPEKGPKKARTTRIELAIVGDPSRPRDFCQKAPSLQKPGKKTR